MNSIKTEIKWAILFSIMSLGWMVLEKASGLHGKYIDYHLYLTNLFAIPAIIMMVLALKEKKTLSYGGDMSYSQGLRSGVILSVFIAALSPLTQWITTYIITPEYFPNVIKRSVELGYFATTAEAEAQFNFSNYVLQGLMGSLIMGVVTSAIAMIFLKSPAKTSDN
jgi:hypothetical protein